MSKEAKIALAIGVPVAIAGVAYLIQRAQVAFKKYLYISAGEGGTTIPPPGTYLYNVNENVTITAVPDEGYTVGTWVVDGVDRGHQDSIAVTMDVDHTVVVTFWKGGQPPPGPVYGIKSLGSVTVISNVGAWITGTPCWDQHIHVNYCGNNWEKGVPSASSMSFFVFDAASRGLSNVDVAVWTDAPPDTGRYRGTTLLDGGVHISVNPLIKKTDANGIVSADVSYTYGLNDNFEQICKDAGVGFQFGCGVLPCVQWLPAKNDYCLPPTCYVCWVSGDCETGLAGCEKMGGWQLNRVYAKVVGTTKDTMEYAYCGFHVKWL